MCWICDLAASETVASRTSFRFVTTCSHLHLPWLCCIKVTIKRQSICNRMGSSCNFKRSCDNVEIVWEWLESDCGCLETGCLLPGIANFAVTIHLMQKNPQFFLIARRMPPYFYCSVTQPGDPRRKNRVVYIIFSNINTNEIRKHKKQNNYLWSHRLKLCPEHTVKLLC